jgi:hypothetical protein
MAVFFYLKERNMKETKQYIPYVVSADTGLLISKWGEEKGLVTPSSNFYQEMLVDLKDKLRDSFDEVEIIPESELKEGINQLVREANYPVVSLDRTYIDEAQPNLMGYLDATRTVDTNLQGTGLKSRLRENSLSQQIYRLAQIADGKPITLIDDVIFEGKTLLEIIEKFRDQGVNIGKVLTGIAIQEGIDLLEANGISVATVVKPYKQVIDEICERDFRVGAPYSGRTIVNGKTTMGAPYLQPFGKPEQWASIPSDQSLDFSLFCLYQSLQMWLEVERLSGQNISTDQIPRQTLGLPQNDSITEALSISIDQLKGNQS